MTAPNNSKITRERACELFEYDPLSGHLLYKAVPGKGRHKSWAGRPAGHVHPNGYIYVGVDRRHVTAHRLIWLMMTGEWPTAEVDHRNLIKSDNRWENLRQATRSQNMHNARRKPPKASGVTGVTKLPSGRWQAKISIDGVVNFLGTYETIDAAKKAYGDAARKMRGEFTRAA